MRCPYCSSADTKVTDSRDTDDGASIRRRRQCLSCGRRFTTYETVEQAPLRVIKKDGTREVFNRNKLRSGLIRACEKRNITSEQIENIVDVVERKVRSDLGQEVSTEMIGNIVMEELRKLDQVAYVRFASVYREFKDIGSFMSELEALMKSSKAKSADSDTAAEFVGRYHNERKSLPAIALTTDSSILTAVGNDYDFDRVFSRQVSGLGVSGDLLWAISTSGNSKNVNEALKTARSKGLKTIGFTGHEGGLMKSLCDVAIVVPADVTARIQEMHILCAHIICQIIDDMEW